MFKVSVKIDRLKLKLHCILSSIYVHSFIEAAIEWLRKQAKDLDLEFNVVRFPPPGEFAVYMTWKGSKGDTLKSILLNSHIDVVPVDEVRLEPEPQENETIISSFKLVCTE